jgi:NAD(P)-dependent dehydrogenase (short-subunit alcohol dehydrogenase family)
MSTDDLHHDERRVAVVTGASSGIGLAAARALAAQGWRVIGVGRDPSRCEAAEAQLRAAAAPGVEVDLLRADLSLLSDTARIAQEIATRIGRVDALLNNAGGVVADRIVSCEGLEATFASNHLAPFLLTKRLRPLLATTVGVAGRGAVRIINVSSAGHQQCHGINWADLTFATNYDSVQAYCHAKLANLLFTRELARQVAADGIVTHAMHPGIVDSNFANHCGPQMKAYMESQKPRAASSEHAADTLVWLATAVEPGRSTGRYYHQRMEVTSSAAAVDDAAARRLWELSESIVQSLQRRLSLASNHGRNDG